MKSIPSETKFLKEGELCFCLLFVVQRVFIENCNITLPRESIHVLPLLQARSGEKIFFVLERTVFQFPATRLRRSFTVH